MTYPQLRDYGVVGNDDRRVLVSRQGSIDWCCLPHLESSSVFARLLGAERVQATIDTVLERLTTDDGLVVRFVDTDIRRDEERAFLLCSFWLVDALVLSNRLERAREYFETVLEYASPLGLYSEKVDPENSRLLGNFPQAFSHLGLINTSRRCSDAVSRRSCERATSCER